MLSIDFLTTVNEVWEQVKLRDWKKYPLNGFPTNYEVKIDTGISIKHPPLITENEH